MTADDGRSSCCCCIAVALSRKEFLQWISVCCVVDKDRRAATHGGTHRGGRRAPPPPPPAAAPPQYSTACSKAAAAKATKQAKPRSLRPQLRSLTTFRLDRRNARNVADTLCGCATCGAAVCGPHDEGEPCSASFGVRAGRPPVMLSSLHMAGCPPAASPLGRRPFRRLSHRCIDCFYWLFRDTSHTALTLRQVACITCVGIYPGCCHCVGAAVGSCSWC
jgi:hypothetical protein